MTVEVYGSEGHASNFIFSQLLHLQVFVHNEMHHFSGARAPGRDSLGSNMFRNEFDIMYEVRIGCDFVF